jgi:hypothetical protein
MKINRHLSSKIAAITGLALVTSVGVGWAQNTNPTNTFDTSASTASFATWWGPTTPTMAWDGTLDAGNDLGSGSVRYSAAFTGAAAEQFMTFFTIANRWGWDGGYILDATTYTNYSFDIKVDPSSSPIKAGGSYGPLEIGLTTDGWGQLGLPTFTIPLTATNWTHVDRPLIPSLVGIDKVNGYFFKIWSDGAHTNTLVFNIDNVKITKPTAPVVIPPPTMSLAKAGPSGVQITMDDNTAQWQRNAISTPAGSGPYLWNSQGSYPVTYSLTITNFPAVASHAGFEAHLYLANGDTSTAGDQTSGSPDWNVPDIFIFRVENRVNTVLTTNGSTITTNFTYDAMAQIQWKTNFPGANATNIPVVVFPPSALGTWTVTFVNSTNGTLTGPGITATNFTLPEAAVLNNFSPATSFAQFGMFKNDGANDGHNNGARGTFSHVKFTGAAAPFDDDFSGATLTDKYAWRKTSASAVQYIPPGSAWLVDWTLPAAGFNAESAAVLAGPWSNAGLTNTYTGGGKVHVLVPSSALPAGNATFFRLMKRVPVKLQVLLPGETNAPGTVTGKIGTPIAQAAYVPFNITVNMVDSTWHILSSSDTVNLTSTDPVFEPSVITDPPRTVPLVNGTVTIEAYLGTAGQQTITATDVTDATKLPNTSARVTVQ